MALQVQTTYGAGIDHSSVLEELIEKESAKLERFFERILSCRILIDKPHRHHLHGSPVHVRLDLVVPGDELVITHPPELRQAPAGDDETRAIKPGDDDAIYRDAQTAVREAFRKARRRLRDYAQRKTAHKA
jgi:ribosome-associated translation inhibitor RaiA